MRKRICNILSFCTLVLLVTACYEDKGNYDYHEISEIEIAGLEKNYTKTSYQEVLHLEPVVTATGGDSDFDYLWTLNLAKSSATTSERIKIKLDTIGTDRILDFPVNLKQGHYEVTLRITNKSNQLVIYQVIPLNVVTKYSEGFYLLKDMGNSTDLDLHLTDTTVVTDIFLKTEGRHLPDAPVSLGLDPGYCYIDENTGEHVITKTITICTENDVRISNVEDMSTIYTHKTMFLSPDEPQEKPYYIWRNILGVGYLSSKGAYFSTQGTWQGQLGSGKFGYPAYVGNEQSPVQPNRNGVFSDEVGFCFFDELQGRFLLLVYTGLLYTYSDLNEDYEETEYKPNGIKHHLKFFGRNFLNKENRGYALFEDATTSGKHYIYQMRLNAKLHNPIEKVTEVTASSKLNGANLYATNELTAKVMYFVHNNRLYMYDLENNTEETLSPAGMSKDEEITYIGNRYWVNMQDNSGNKEGNFDYLAFATYKNGKYKVYLYEILGGKPYGEPVRILEGEGKVVKIQYLDFDMNLKAFFDFPGSL